MSPSLLVNFLLVSPAAPVPVPPPAPPAANTVDRHQNTQFVGLVWHTSQLVRGMYLADVTTNDLFIGAIRGLYDAAGVKVPDDLIQAANRASDAELQNLLAEARQRLGNSAALAGPRSLMAAVNGFKHAMDPYCGIAGPRIN